MPAAAVALAVAVAADVVDGVEQDLPVAMPAGKADAVAAGVAAVDGAGC